MEYSTDAASMHAQANPPADPNEILALGRECTETSLECLRAYSAPEIARALTALTPDQRIEFLETAERLDEIVPLLSEAEFTRTIRNYGIEESGWIVEFASADQRVAAIDLDCWRDSRFSPSRFFDWVDAMIEAGPETLAACFSEIDREIWVMAMRAMGSFMIVGTDPDQAEAGGMTIDGVVYYEADGGDSEDRIREILTTAHQLAPTHYWELVYGAIDRSEGDSGEYAIRWHRNRLSEMGFPEHDRAIGVYKPLRADEVPILQQDSAAEPHAIVPQRSGSALEAGANLLRSAMAELAPERADDIMRSIFAVANSIAVADRLPLTEESAAERSLAKALRGTEIGLIEVSRTQSRRASSVLESIPATDLFRIGASLDPALRRSDGLSTSIASGADIDWNIEKEPAFGDEGNS